MREGFLRHGARPAIALVPVALLALFATASPGAAPPRGEGCAHGTWVSGSDASGRYRACYAGSALVLVEDRPPGAPKAAAQRYLYADDALVGYRADARPRVAGGGADASAAAVPVTIDWTAAGDLRRAVRVEHYGEVRVPDAVVERARARGLELQRAARALRPAP